MGTDPHSSSVPFRASLPNKDRRPGAACAVWFKRISVHVWVEWGRERERESSHQTPSKQASKQASKQESSHLASE